VDRTLIAIKRRRESGAVAGGSPSWGSLRCGQGIPGPTAHRFVLGVPRLVGVVLAHPTGVLTAATYHVADMGSTFVGRQSSGDVARLPLAQCLARKPFRLALLRPVEELQQIID
jgi:hypothetical protein